MVLMPASLNASTLFKPVQGYNSGGANAVSIAIADVNGDRRPDLIVANGCIICGTGAVFGVGVLLGNGDGTFQTAQNYNLNNMPVIAVAVGDVNSDGNPDLVASTECLSSSACGSGAVWVLAGNGDGTLRAPVNYGSGGLSARYVAIADMNGDGNPDLLVANCASIGAVTCFSGSGNIGVLLGHGDGTFQSANIYGSGGENPWRIAVGDVNRDGKVDVVVVNCAPITGGCERSGVDSVLGVLLGKGDGTFQQVQTYDSGGGASGSVAIADLNGDGNPDLAVANGEVGVLLGNGDGTFQPARIYGSGGSGATSVVVADVNKDGKPDLLVANSFCGHSYSCLHGSVGALLGNGDGTFQAARVFNSGGYGAFSIATADLNGDYKPDLAVANNCASDGHNVECGTGVVGILLGTVGFSTSTSISSSLNPSIYGQNVSWTAMVTSSGASMATGSVSFVWSGNSIGSAILNSSGVATLTKSNVNADAYPLTAVYHGDAVNDGSTSAVLNQIINQATSSASIGSTPNPSTQGQPVTFTATITSPTATPTGPVTFTAGTTVLGTGQLTKGKATFTTSSLPVGATTVKATYSGNSNVAGSSASIRQTVQ